MSFVDERRAIELWFTQQWTGAEGKAGLQPGILVEYENVPFPPDDVQQPSTWVTLEILNGQGMPLDIGTDSVRHRYTGVIQNIIHASVGKGTQTATSLADQIASIWKGRTLEDRDSGQIVCLTPSIQVIGSKDGEFLIAVSTEYYRTENPTPRPQ